MHLLDRAVLPTPVPPCLTPPRRKRHALNKLKVVFSTAGDLIKVHSYGDHCSATWDACLGDVPADVANGWALLINDYAASPVQARAPSLVVGAEGAA